MNDDDQTNLRSLPKEEWHLLRDQQLAVIAMRAFPNSSQIVIFVEAGTAQYCNVGTINIDDHG